MTRYENVGVYSNIFKPSNPLYPSAYKDEIECCETSTYKIQRPGNYPEENTQYSEHSESLKSRITSVLLLLKIDFCLGFV